MSTADYSANHERVDGIEVVRLSDAAAGLEAAIAVSVGNMAYELTAGGRNVLWFPFDGPANLKANPALCGIPFLAPWANRLDEDAYWVDGTRYLLNPGLGNLRRDGNGKPIHGLLNFSPAWALEDAGADHESAYATSRLEFWKRPEMMAQFPFAHTISMTYRLVGGALEVETALENLSETPLPVSIGYHPYFQLHDASRDEWKAYLAARSHVILDDRLIPTGERRPVTFANPHPLSSGQLDDVFTDLVRDPDGRAVFSVEGRRQRISVTYGTKYRVAVVYAPEGREFICFEPMAAVTNAFNLAHAGKYSELQTVAPGGVWRESFWITPTGF
jgi:aldose 1-epimerase